MSAIRLARGFTGRSHDRQVRRAATTATSTRCWPRPAAGVATFALPDSAGVPASSAGETIVLPYNDLAAVEAAFAERGDADRRRDHRGVAGQHGRRPAGQPGFTEGLRRITRAHGALLISDEVMTGFRCSRRRVVRARGSVRRGPRRPVHLRQGDGRGLPRRRLRWPRRRHGDAGAARARSTRRAPSPVTRSPPPPGSRRCAAAPRRSTTGSTSSPTPSPRRPAEELGRAGVPHVDPVGRQHVLASSSATARCATTTTPRTQNVAGLHGVLPLDAEPGRAPAAERVRVVVRQRGPRRRRVERGGRRLARRRRRRRPGRLRHSRHEPRATRPRSCTCCATARSTTPRACSTAGSTATTSPTSAAQMAAAGRPATWPTTTSPSSWPPRSTGPRRPPPRSRPRTGSGVTTDDRVIEVGNHFEGKRIGVRRRRPAPAPPLAEAASTRSSPSWGEPYEEIAARMLAAIARRAPGGRGPRGGHRLPPAADLDRPQPARGPAAVARPAPSPVLPGVADDPRPTSDDELESIDLLRARRPRCCRGASKSGGRLRRCRARWWPPRCWPLVSSPRARSGPQLHRGAGQGRATARATSPVTARSSSSPPATAAGAGDARGHHARGPPWSMADACRQGRRRQRLGLVVRARASPRRPTCRRPGTPCSASAKPVQFMGIDYREEPRDRGAAFQKANKVTYPSLADDGGRAHPRPAGQGGHHPDDAGPRPAGPHRGPGLRTGHRRARCTALVDDVLGRGAA